MATPLDLLIESLIRAGIFVTGARDIANAITTVATGGVVIVNDLTTGGTTSALSAEMGKTLNTGKQASLVSGANIKTVGGQSLLGSGDIPIATSSVFTAVANGLAPASGGGTVAYLRADGTWQTPAGAGDMSLAAIQTVTGAKTFNDGKLLLQGATTGQATLHAAAVAGASSWTFPNTTADSVVGLSLTQTLLNKTLTTPVIASILNGAGTLTLPTSTDTLVGRDTTDTLTNKSLTSPAMTGTPTAPTATQGDNSTKVATTAYSDRVFSATQPGGAPPSGGGTTNYLRADGNWAAPAGGGGGGGGSPTVVSYTTALPLDTVGAGKKFASLTLTTPTTYSIAGGSVDDAYLTMCLVGDGNGAHIPTFPSPFKYSGGAYNTTLGAQNIYAISMEYSTPFVYRTDGSIIAAPPGSPTGLGGTLTSTTAPLAWTAPSTGGTPTDYLVEYKAAASGTWLTWTHAASTAVSITITGLTASTAYNFRVSAVNLGGTSSPSTQYDASTGAAVVTIASDDFTGTGGTSFSGRSTPVGSKAYGTPYGNHMMLDGAGLVKRTPGDRAVSTIDAGTSTYHVEIDVPTPEYAGYPLSSSGLIIRVTTNWDSAIYISAQTADTIAIYSRNVTGGDTYVDGKTQTGLGAHISVDVTPTTITVRGAGGVLVATWTDTTINPTATKVGLWAGGDTSRMDNFLVTT